MNGDEIMREVKRFWINSTEDDTMWYANPELLSSKISELRSKLSENGTYYDGLNLYIYSNSSDMDLIWSEAKKLSLIPEIVGYNMQYSKSDYKDADCFMLSIQIFGKGDFTESYQTQYIEELKCEKCKRSVFKQDSELYIDKTVFKNKDIGITSNREIVISEKVKDILLSAEISGIKFANVNHKNTRIKNDFNVYQLLIDNTISKMDESTTVYYDPMGYCRYCDNHGMLLTSLPKYKKVDIKNIKDFNLTYEYFGGGEAGFKNIIVSRKVFELFKRNKLKGCMYDIVLTV